MDGTWYYDPDDPLLDWFEEDLIELSDSTAVADVVYKKLEELLGRHGMVGYACMMGDEVVHIVTTGRYEAPVVVPALVIALFVEAKENILRPFLLCKVDDVNLEGAGGPSPSPDAPTRESIEDRIRRRLLRRERPHNH